MVIQGGGYSDLLAFHLNNCLKKLLTLLKMHWWDSELNSCFSLELLKYMQIFHM